MASLDDLTDQPETVPERLSLDQQIVDQLQSAFPMVGSMLGGIAGLGLSPFGALGGAGLGYELGERTARLGQSIADYLVPVPPGSQTALGKQMRAPSTPLGELGRTATNIATGTTAEAGGQALGAGAKGLAALASRKFPVAQPGARAVQSELQTVGSRLTPAQFTDNRTIDVMEGIAEGALLGGPIEGVKKGQQTAIQSLVDRTLAEVDSKMGVRGVSKFLEDAVRGRRVWGKVLQRAAYKQVDEIAGVGVDTSEVVSFIETALSKNQTNVKRALDAALPTWRDILMRPQSQARIFGPNAEQIVHIPGANTATFAEAATARSALLTLSRKKAIAPEDEVVTKTAGMLAGKLDTAMQQATGTLAPEALAAFREANALTKHVEQTLNNESVRAVVRKLSTQPAKLAQVLLQPNNVDVLERVRDAAPGAWPTVQAKLAESTVLKAMNPAKNGEFNGKSFLKGLKAIGPETAETAFGTETLAALQRLGETANFVQAAHAAGTGAGSMVIKLTQGGAMVTLALAPFAGFPSGPAAAGVGATLLGPYVMGKLMASPKAIHLLADGLKPGIGVEQAGRIAAQLTAYTAKGRAPLTPEGALAPSAAATSGSLLDQIK